MTYCDVTRRLSIRKFVFESMSESRTLLATLYSTLDCAYSTVHPVHCRLSYSYTAGHNSYYAMWPRHGSWPARSVELEATGGLALSLLTRRRPNDSQAPEQVAAAPQS